MFPGSISNIDDAEFHCNKSSVRKVISGVVGAASSVTSIQALQDTPGKTCKSRSLLLLPNPFFYLTNLYLPIVFVPPLIFSLFSLPSPFPLTSTLSHLPPSHSLRYLKSCSNITSSESLITSRNM
ncbi:hypothetical protein J6590_081103 [Homalodisca vitripennis]|nr:hypothetical protein J6590_081103 [Homalodisca vitripennis]